MDFTLKTYKTLLKALKKQGFSFQTFQEFIQQPRDKSIVLRHDVDKLPENSLRFAQIQHELGIKGSYFFRMVPQSFHPEIIKEIAKLGHEIGYHYEDLDLASKNSSKSEIWSLKSEKFLAEQAIKLFNKHLKELRKFAPVTTICMHGSPLSKYDNKLLWKYYNYKDFDLIGEPYFDVNFTKVLYLTDTGRRWNGEKVSIRDKVNSKNSVDTPSGSRKLSGEGAQKQALNYKSTYHIISAAKNGELADQMMFTFHPQRWTDDPILWTKELVWQNVKNVAKYFLNKTRT